MKIYNPNLSTKIVDELNYLNSNFFQFDKPIPFKDGLTIYPVLTRDHDLFLNCSNCLTLNKMDDANGISLSNLGYLIYKMSDAKHPDESATYSQFLIHICEMVFHVKYGIRCEKCNKFYDYYEFVKMIAEKKEEITCECGSKDFDVNIRYRTNKNNQKELFVDGTTITISDFDRLRQIIMYQNLPDYKDDSWVDPEMREDQAEKQRMIARKNKSGTATLERKIVCVSAKTCYKIQDIYDMPMRKFLILLSAVDDAMVYESSRIGLMTGMVSTKEPLEHWIYKRESDDLYGDGVTLEQMQKNIASAV